MPATRELPHSDPAGVHYRLTVALAHMHPGKTEFSISEVMEALHVIGELPGPVPVR